jgi:hypothetical protein
MSLLLAPLRHAPGERIRGRHNIQESRFVQPNKKRAVSVTHATFAGGEAKNQPAA